MIDTPQVCDLSQDVNIKRDLHMIQFLRQSIVNFRSLKLEVDVGCVNQTPTFSPCTHKNYLSSSSLLAWILMILNTWVGCTEYIDAVDHES